MIPLATTTITIKGRRPQSAVDPDAEGYDAPAPELEVLATGVRATITQPRGSRDSTRTDEFDVYAFRCDPVNADITRFDTVIDETNGTEYLVSVAYHSLPLAFGLTHITGRLRHGKGLRTGGGGEFVPTGE